MDDICKIIKGVKYLKIKLCLIIILLHWKTGEPREIEEKYIIGRRTR